MEQVSKIWYVVYTKPRNEKKVAESLNNLGIESYCPTMVTIRQWSDRRKKVKIPMFNSYVFVKTDQSDYEKIRRNPGVLNFVYWLGKPATVREEEIKAIKRITQDGTEILVESQNIRKGDMVKIKEGPFKGLYGEVEDSTPNRLALYIQQLSCKVLFTYPQLELANN